MVNRLRSIAPETHYGDVTAKVRAFEALSHRFAAAGRVFEAVHAAWAADVFAVQAVMWERVMVASPQPDEAFLDLAGAVSQALGVFAGQPVVGGEARDVVLAARKALGSAFDERALSMLAYRYIDLDHLAGLAMPDAAAGARLAAARLGDSPVAEIAEDRRAASGEQAVLALTAAADGRHAEAVEHVWRADWACLEAYLLDCALMVGDQALVTVELRWALVRQEFASLAVLPGVLGEAAQQVRERMIAVLGPVEGERLRERFAPLG